MLIPVADYSVLVRSILTVALTAASDIYAPVSGVIEEINEELGDQPALLNRSPEENGKQNLQLSCLKAKFP